MIKSLILNIENNLSLQLIVATNQRKMQVIITFLMSKEKRIMIDFLNQINILISLSFHSFSGFLSGYM